MVDGGIVDVMGESEVYVMSADMDVMVVVVTVINNGSICIMACGSVVGGEGGSISGLIEGCHAICADANIEQSIATADIDLFMVLTRRSVYMMV